MGYEGFDFLDYRSTEVEDTKSEWLQQYADANAPGQAVTTQPEVDTRPTHTRQSLSISHIVSMSSPSQISPPLTPHGEMSEASMFESEATFHHYLRAFYPFHPSSTVSSDTDESSITVPINQGDIILVHSIHPNGWADGTLLESGARGWLPTNYCEAYNPMEMSNLMNALTYIWDLVRISEDDSLVAFARQDYMRGMIAGVRFLLVSI